MIYMDNVQQNQYESVREAYEQMEKEKYQITMEMLLECRDAQNSVAYWKMMELINGKDSEYTLGNIEAAIEKCKTQIIGNNNKNEK